MSDPLSSITPKRRRWPLAAMSALIGLLATFLVVKITRPPDDSTEVVRTPAPPPPPPPVDPPAPPKIDPADQLLAEAEAALKEGRLDEAAAKAEQAKATRGPAAAALLARIDEARKKLPGADATKIDEEEKKKREEAAAQEKERLAREAAFAELERADAEAKPLMAAYKWDAAIALFDAAVKNHPMLADVSDYQSARKRVEDLRQGAAKAFASNAEKARLELKAGRFGAATRLARMAESFYPENPEGAALLKEIAAQMLEANLVPIPATIKGGVKLGDPKRADEPERVYTSPGFLMDKYEVTNEDYQLFVQQARHRPPPSPHWLAGEVRPGSERYPVTHVSVADAEAFAAWAKKRLPTEDEWEYAARWNDARDFPWGPTEPEDRKPLCQTLEVSLPQGSPPPGTRPVGSWPGSASPFGIHDLAGNVWEWTATALDGRRILKGGSFLNRVAAARASNRLADDPDLLHPDVGFRCVKDRP